MTFREMWNPTWWKAEAVAELNWRQGDFRTPFPISLAGEWSPRQAFRVSESLRDQAERQGLMVVPIDVTMLGGPRRQLLLVLCRRHDHPVEPGRVCEKCYHEWPR